MNEFQYDGELPAEIADQLERKAKDEMRYDSELAAGLGFTPDDLAANREGVMTEWQRNALKKRTGNKQWIYGGLLFLWCMTMFFAAVSSVPPLAILGASVVFLLLVTPIVVFYYEWAFNFINDANEGVVKEYMGRVILDAHGCTLTIRSQRFTLSRPAYLRFKHLDYYTIYYTPRTRIILSAEPME